jgi:hypothetical protein
MLEIKSGVSGVQTVIEGDTWESFSKAKAFLLQKSAQPTRSLVNKHTEWEVHSIFISNETLPLTRIDPHLGSQLFLIGVGEGLTFIAQQGNKTQTSKNMKLKEMKL